MLCNIAKLENDKLEAIQKLEKEVGKTLVAFSCHDVKPAELSDDQLSKIKAAEDEIGFALVAV